MGKARADGASGALRAPAPGDRICKGVDGQVRRFVQLRDVLPSRWVEHANIEQGSAHVQAQIEAMNHDLYRLARHLKRLTPRRTSGYVLIDVSGSCPVFDVANARWELPVKAVMRDGCRVSLVLSGDHHCRHADTGTRLPCARADRWVRSIRAEQRRHNSQPPSSKPSRAQPLDTLIGQQCSQPCFIVGHSDGTIAEHLHDMDAWVTHARIRTLGELRRAVAAHNAAYHPDSREADE